MWNRTKRIAALLSGALPFLAAAPAGAASFHVDGLGGSDAASGTSADQAWKTLERANKAVLKPGDSLLFKCGGQWQGQLDLRASGVEGDPVTVGAYGAGDAPLFTNPDKGSANAIDVSGDWNVVTGLRVRDVLMVGINVGLGSEHNVFRKVEASGCGLGMYIAGRYNLVTESHFHDLHTMVNTPGGNDDNGAVGVVIANSDIEVSYGLFVNCIGPSYDYVVDGGAVEIWAERDVRNVHIHHNRVRRCCGFFEVGGLGFAVEGVRVAYNELVDCFGLSFLLFNNSGDYSIALKDYRFENNTVIVHDCPGERVWTCVSFMVPSDPGVFTMRNNLFYVFNADRILDKATAPVTDRNLVFHGGTAWFDKNFAAAATDILGKDPLFADPGSCAVNGDYRLKEGSPAIDAGAALGYSADLKGEPVPGGTHPDIGAYESRPGGVPLAAPGWAGAGNRSRYARPIPVDAAGRPRLRGGMARFSRPGIVPALPSPSH
ncbi:MAG: hemolysin-type calcium-binding region [Fibrobacteres bacterium]|nr:hemolysin-type calcium-binding region [Fibrobacterota bacterium]